MGIQQFHEQTITQKSSEQFSINFQEKSLNFEEKSPNVQDNSLKFSSTETSVEQFDTINESVSSESENNNKINLFQLVNSGEESDKKSGNFVSGEIPKNGDLKSGEIPKNGDFPRMKSKKNQIVRRMNETATSILNQGIQAMSKLQGGLNNNNRSSGLSMVNNGQTMTSGLDTTGSSGGFRTRKRGGIVGKGGRNFMRKIGVGSNKSINTGTESIKNGTTESIKNGQTESIKYGFGSIKGDGNSSSLSSPCPRGPSSLVPSSMVTTSSSPVVPVVSTTTTLPASSSSLQSSFHPSTSSMGTAQGKKTIISSANVSTMARTLEATSSSSFAPSHSSANASNLSANPRNLSAVPNSSILQASSANFHPPASPSFAPFQQASSSSVNGFIPLTTGHSSQSTSLSQGSRSNLYQGGSSLYQGGSRLALPLGSSPSLCPQGGVVEQQKSAREEETSSPSVVKYFKGTSSVTLSNSFFFQHTPPPSQKIDHSSVDHSSQKIDHSSQKIDHSPQQIDHSSSAPVERSSSADKGSSFCPPVTGSSNNPISSSSQMNSCPNSNQVLMMTTGHSMVNQVNTGHSMVNQVNTGHSMVNQGTNHNFCPSRFPLQTIERRFNLSDNELVYNLNTLTNPNTSTNPNTISNSHDLILNPIHSRSSSTSSSNQNNSINSIHSYFGFGSRFTTLDTRSNSLASRLAKSTGRLNFTGRQNSSSERSSNTMASKSSLSMMMSTMNLSLKASKVAADRAHDHQLSICDSCRESIEWYFGSLPREASDVILCNQPLGTFLVRDSITKSGSFALSVRVPRSLTRPSGVAHYLLVRASKDNRVKIQVRTIFSILSIWTLYQLYQCLDAI